MSAKVMTENGVSTATLRRILREGYGPGAWHGPDLAAAIADVTAAAAYRRPGEERHNIAEIALHHAWVVRNVVSQLTGKDPAAFPLEGEDWFELNGESDIAWSAITGLLNTQQLELDAALDAKPGKTAANDKFDVVLGVTCHAIYHAGQIQLIKRLIAM